MDEHGKSDRFVVPANSPNNASEQATEVGEGRGRTKGNTPERNASRTQSRRHAPSALERVRQVAKQDNLSGPINNSAPWAWLPPHDEWASAPAVGGR
jgi:hypothetical protein